MSIKKYIESQQKRGINIHTASDVMGSVRTIPSGSLLIDHAIGTPGYPVPRIVQIYGEPSSGKSLMTLMSEAYVTKSGYYTVRCDTENDFNTREQQERREKYGVDLTKCIDIPGNQTAEKIMDTVIELLNKYPDEIRLVTIDSVSALTSTSRDEKKLEKGHIDDTPRLMANFCKKINASNQNAVVFMISHTGANIGSMSHEPYAKGGKAIQFYAGLRLWVKGFRSPDSVDDEGFYHTHQMDVVVKKNKSGLPGGRANHLMFNNVSCHFDMAEELITLGKEKELFEVAGSWYTYTSPHSNEPIRVQGRTALKQYLIENPVDFHSLFERVTNKKIEEYFKIV